MVKTHDVNDSFDKGEAERRFKTALRTALNTPPKHQADMKLGKTSRGRRRSAKLKAKRSQD